MYLSHSSKQLRQPTGSKTWRDPQDYSLHISNHGNITLHDQLGSYLQTLLWSQMGLCSSQ